MTSVQVTQHKDTGKSEEVKIPRSIIIAVPLGIASIDIGKFNYTILIQLRQEGNNPINLFWEKWELQERPEKEKKTKPKKKKKAEKKKKSHSAGLYDENEEKPEEIEEEEEEKPKKKKKKVKAVLTLDDFLKLTAKLNKILFLLLLCDLFLVEKQRAINYLAVKLEQHTLSYLQLRVQEEKGGKGVITSVPSNLKYSALGCPKEIMIRKVWSY